MKKNRKRLAGILGLTGLVIVVATASCFFRSRTFSDVNPQTDDGMMEADMARIVGEEYDSVMLSMHSTKYIYAEDFSYFMAMDTLVASHSILDTKELSRYLDGILDSGNPVTSLTLGLDPELLWNDARHKEDVWEKKMEKGLYSYVREHPEISFAVILPAPYIGYWTGFEEGKLDTLLTVYRRLVDELSVYGNVKIQFPGCERWIMINPDNYEAPLFDTNEYITKMILLYTWCDRFAPITPENKEDIWNALCETIEAEKNRTEEYPDLSGLHIVFFGDSVLANYPGSSSIPGYVTGLSGATFENHAVGGSSAVDEFSDALDSFFEEGKEMPADKRLCFVIEYGLNDYFSGLPVEDALNPDSGETYTGALRSGISRLQEAYPEAEIILMTPAHIGSFDKGMQATNEEKNVLADYVEAAKETAREMGLHVIDNYDDLVITSENQAEYLLDGIHPNEEGRVEIALHIIEVLGEM